MTRAFAIVLACAVLSSVPVLCAAGDIAHSRKDVLAVAARVADWQLAHLDGEYLTHFKDESRSPRSWEQGAFWLGLTHLADAGGAPRFGQAVLDMGRTNQWTPGPRLYHADDQVIGAPVPGLDADVVVRVFGVPEEAAWRAVPRNRECDGFVVAKNYEDTECLRRWCWCDALFMAPPAWVELSRQTKDPRYRDYALQEFWATTDFLYDPAEQLYFRDSRFFERRDTQGRKQFWSRGNGWVFAGIANILDALPSNHPQRARLETLFRAMAGRLKNLQKADGYWPPSLLAPENSPPETSGTGFHVYGLAWGVKHGLLDAAEYAVVETDSQFYGVGAFLLAGSAVAQLKE